MSNLRRMRLALIIIAGCIVFVWLVGTLSRHPEFGRIYSTEMVEENLGDSWQTGWERKEAALRRVLHLRERPKPPQRGMPIGPAELGWSLGGHIYMSSPQSDEPLWELALSNRKRLREVRREELQCEFYGVNDPRGTDVFGPADSEMMRRPAWEGHAIRVADGQVLFARLVTNRSTIYVIQLGAWGYTTKADGSQIGRIHAKYVVVTNPTSKKITGTNVQRHVTGRIGRSQPPVSLSFVASQTKIV